MHRMNKASQAYAAAAITRRSTREQEADVFREVIATMQVARQASPIERVRALADNRRLWSTVTDTVRDPTNALARETRAGILSIGLTVQREMDAAEPNFDFLISINKQIAEGLSGNP